jgi:DNA gyrase/topoisomerase IV subunit B
LLRDAVYEFARKRVNIAVEEWLKQNPEKVEEIVDKVIREGMANILLQTIIEAFRQPMQLFQSSVIEMLRKVGIH